MHYSKKGLGDEFIEKALSRIETIEQNPELFPIKHKAYREVTIPTFSFVIIYRTFKKKKIVNIFSEFHTSQNPKRKYRRA